jgi:hypothetical protein
LKFPFNAATAYASVKARAAAGMNGSMTRLMFHVLDQLFGDTGIIFYSVRTLIRQTMFGCNRGHRYYFLRLVVWLGMIDGKTHANSTKGFALISVNGRAKPLSLAHRTGLSRV